MYVPGELGTTRHLVVLCVCSRTDIGLGCLRGRLAEHSLKDGPWNVQLIQVWTTDFQHSVDSAVMEYRKGLALAPIGRQPVLPRASQGLRRRRDRRQP